MTTKELLSEIRSIVREEISYTMKEVLTEIKNVRLSNNYINETAPTQINVDQRYNPVGITKKSNHDLIPKAFKNSKLSSVFLDTLDNIDKEDEFFDDDDATGQWPELNITPSDLFDYRDAKANNTNNVIRYDNVHAFNVPAKENDILKSFEKPSYDDPEFIGASMNKIQDPRTKKNLEAVFTADYSKMFKK
jgi:hypothetical protein